MYPDFLDGLRIEVQTGGVVLGMSQGQLSHSSVRKRPVFRNALDII